MDLNEGGPNDWGLPELLLECIMLTRSTQYIGLIIFEKDQFCLFERIYSSRSLTGLKLISRHTIPMLYGTLYASTFPPQNNVSFCFWLIVSIFRYTLEESDTNSFAIKDYLFPLVIKLMSAKGVPTSMGPSLWYYNIYI